jgi:hypothetical protein
VYGPAIKVRSTVAEKTYMNWVGYLIASPVICTFAYAAGSEAATAALTAEQIAKLPSECRGNDPAKQAVLDLIKIFRVATKASPFSGTLPSLVLGSRASEPRAS